MVEKKHPYLTDEQIRELEKELEELQKKREAILREADSYEQSIIEKVGDRPVIRNPAFKKTSRYRNFVDADGNVEQWFWIIKPDDEPKLKAMKAALRREFIYDALMTPEESEEHDRILAKCDPLDVREREIRYILEGLPPEIARKKAEKEVYEEVYDDDEESDGEDGHQATIFV